jgi:hypothetical protein
MIVSILVASTLLVGQTAAPTHSGEKQKTTSKAAAEVDPQKAMSEYYVLKEKTPMTAAARWKLALWCEEHGLKDIAHVHFREVVWLDPKRDAAWRRLGFKRHGNHWATDAQIAEDHEQKKADKFWGPHLQKVHKDIHGANGKPKKRLAQAELDKISDPRAVVSVYREFGGGGNSDHLIAVDVLSRIDKPISSKVLALIAVYGKTTDVRRRATEVLRVRPSKDFLDLLVSLMIDPYRYEVKPVGGPGSPGVLFVEGEKFKVNRFYAPPAAPNITPQPGDIITYDQNGNPIINRPVRQAAVFGEIKGVAGSKPFSVQRELDFVDYAEISPSQLKMEAEKGALVAKNQLDADVNMIKSINKDRNKFNDLVMAVAMAATGKDGGKTPKEWRETLAAGSGVSKQPTAAKPIYGEMVALAYNPVFAPVGISTQTLLGLKLYRPPAT